MSADPNDGNSCQGYGGEDCGQDVPPGNDLCPDDTMARMDDQSPRPNQ